MNNLKLTESEISRLVDEFKAKIIRVIESQSEVSDDIDENEIIEKNQLLSFKTKSIFAYRMKRTDINVILSDIEEYGDDACLLIENDIKVKEQEVNRYKLTLSRKINDIFPDQYKKLSILEEEVALLKLKLEERKKQTITLLAAAELKGENELSEIMDSEREANSLSKVREKKYKEARYKEIRNKVDKINNEYRNMGLALPRVDVDSFGNIVLTSELLSLIDK